MTLQLVPKKGFEVVVTIGEGGGDENGNHQEKKSAC
jgi:hypothetical protein